MASKKKTTKTKKDAKAKKAKPRPVPPTGGGQASILTGMGGSLSRG